ncbi:MAG: hypothetical protein LUD15_15190 [Bacteroides sp.]|nr:hypothetical protein [Bacteroides sp.]
MSEDYCAGKMTVKDLLKKYALPSSLSSLWRYLPDRVSEDKCPYCNVPLLQPHYSRQLSERKPVYCPECSHQLIEKCRCAGCYAIKQEEIRREQSQKREIYKKIVKVSALEKVDFNTLEFKEKVYLGAFLREGISEDCSFVFPVENFDNVLAPTLAATEGILDCIVGTGAIWYHPDVNLDAVDDLDPVKNDFTYYPVKMKWEINLVGEDRVALVNSIIDPSFEVTPWEAYGLWKEIAMHEAIEYLCYSMANVLKVNCLVGKNTLCDFKITQ